MEEVYSCMVDKRGTGPDGAPRLLSGASSSWLGPQVRWSEDLGQTWHETPNGAIRFAESEDASVERIWQLTAGAEDGVVWAGTEPGAVWRSTDGGEHFALEEALWRHPQRSEWGAGFGGQAFHTILPHPTDPRSATVAISTGGVYQTEDDGGSWNARNQGIRAEFLPEGQQYPEFGQCVHKVTRHPSRPERLYLQNHGGVYRSDDHAASWQSIAEGLPADFGFPVVVHPHEPDTIYVFPLNAGEGRYPTDGRARVWRSTDAGDSWEALGGRASGRVLRRGHARRDDGRRPRSGRPVRRRPQRRRVGLGGRGGDLASAGLQPSRRDGGPGRVLLSRTRVRNQGQLAWTHDRPHLSA